MPLDLGQIENEALKLAPASRAHLAERLLFSLESLTDEEREALWVEEAQRRDREIDQGDASTKPADLVFREAREKLQ